MSFCLKLYVFLSALPVVRTEREEGQTSSVLQVAYLEVAETVADGNGVGNIGRPYLYRLVPVSATRLPEMFGNGHVELAVLTCNLKA